MNSLLITLAIVICCSTVCTTAFSPAPQLFQRPAHRVESLSRQRQGQFARFAVCQADDTLVRKRKEMPAYVQDLLKKESVVENPLDAAQIVTAIKDPKGMHRRKSNVVNTEVFVRGLPWDMDRKSLRTLFEKYAPLYARVVMDARNKTRSQGYGFVGFQTTSKANAAIRALNGTEVESSDGKKLKLSLSFAAEKVQRRKMASKTDQQNFMKGVELHKRKLSARDTGKVVMTADDMPRRWKVIQDLTSMKKEEFFADEESDEELEGEIDDARAERALRAFLDAGNTIEDVSPEQLAREAEETRLARESGELDLGEEEFDSDEEDEAADSWTFVPSGGLDGIEDIEEEEEERRNWEEFKRAQLKGKVNLRPAEEVKPSGALRSGQKKMDSQRPRPDRSTRPVRD